MLGDWQALGDVGMLGRSHFTGEKTVAPGSLGRLVGPFKMKMQLSGNLRAVHCSAQNGEPSYWRRLNWSVKQG